MLLPAAAGRWQWDLAQVAWQMSAQAQVAFALSGDLLGSTVSVAIASCAEHSCSSASLGKPPSPVERFWTRVCSLLCLSSGFRLG